MKRLYRAAHLPEAELLKDRLLDAGIPAVVKGGLLTGILGEIPVDITPEVWIENEADWARAQAVVRDYEAALRRERPPPSWTCPRCAAEVDGELGLCWRCGAPRPQ